MIATHKTSTLCDVPLPKKSKKTGQNSPFLKIVICGGLSGIFLATVHRKELRFFALQSVRPGTSFELSNTPVGIFFFFRVIIGFWDLSDHW